MGSHNPTLWGLASSLALAPFYNRCGTPQSTPPSRPSVLAGTLPRVHPLQGSTSSLAHCPVPSSDTICNGPSPTSRYYPLWTFPFVLSLKVSTPLQMVFVLLPQPTWDLTTITLQSFSRMTFTKYKTTLKLNQTQYI